MLIARHCHGDAPRACWERLALGNRKLAAALQAAVATLDSLDTLKQARQGLQDVRDILT